MRFRSNKGATLVELLVAMAVLAILMGQLGLLVYNSATLYKKGSYEVDLQAESQQFVNQLQELMIDCDGMISFNATTSISDDAVIEITNSCNNVGTYTVALHRDSSTATMGGQVMLSKTGDGAFGDVLMADYVESVSIDMSAYQSTSKVTIYVNMRNNEYSYRSATDLYLRNDIGLSVNNAVNYDTAAYDYELDALRFSEYNLDDEFGEDGHTYKYYWADSAGPTFYDGLVADGTSKNVKCGATLNNSFTFGPSGSHLSAGPFIINRIDDADGSTKTIAVSTRKVSVGAAGKPGTTKGFGLIYQSAGTSADYDGYVPVFGVDLSKATAVESSFEFKFGTATKFDSYNYSAGDTHHIGSNLTFSSGTDSLTPKTYSSLTTGTMSVYDGGEYKDKGTLQGLGNDLEVRTDKASNCVVFNCGGHITTPDLYYFLIEKGGMCYTKTKYTFDGGSSIIVYGFLYPLVPGSGGGGSSVPNQSGPGCGTDSCPNQHYASNGYVWTDNDHWECSGCHKYMGNFAPTKGGACGVAGCSAQWSGTLTWDGSEFKCPSGHSEGAGGGGASGPMSDEQREKFYDTVDAMSHSL